MVDLVAKESLNKEDSRRVGVRTQPLDFLPVVMAHVESAKLGNEKGNQVTRYYDVTNPSTMTHLPYYSDGTNSATMTSLTDSLTLLL